MKIPLSTLIWWLAGAWSYALVTGTMSGEVKYATFFVGLVSLITYIQDWWDK